MANAQPANTSISVFRRLRVIRDNRAFTTIKHYTTPFDGQDVVVPGEEVLVLERRDAAFRSDAFRYGHPIVVEPRTACTMATVYAGIPGLDFPVRMAGNWREVQIQKDPAHRTDDLYAQAQTLCPGRAFIV
jgi:hypothetical protein